jgi:transcription initiation factor TFIIA small subunit
MALTLSSIGESLVDTIDDLIEDGRIEPQLALRVLANFDRVVSETLAEKVKGRLTFKVSVSKPTALPF